MCTSWHTDRYIGSLFWVDEPVPDDSLSRQRATAPNPRLLPQVRCCICSLRKGKRVNTMEQVSLVIFTTVTMFAVENATKPTGNSP